MFHVENQTYKLAKNHTQRAIIATLLLAKEKNCILTVDEIKAFFKQLNIKTSAQKTAFKFYKPFWDGDVWYKFPFVSNQDIADAYNYYLNHGSQEFFNHLRFPPSPAEKTKNDMIEELHYKNQELEDDNASMSRMGWRQQMLLDDMREKLHSVARRTIDELIQSFRNMNVAIVTTESKLGVAMPELDKRTKKILQSQTDGDIENMLRRYSDPSEVFSHTEDEE